VQRRVAVASGGELEAEDGAHELLAVAALALAVLRLVVGVAQGAVARGSLGE
jgi:hypothetical protein